MRVVVTRPETDAERTAETLRARGHTVLLAPLMQIEPLPADLSGPWTAIAVTSANALSAIAHSAHSVRLRKLPVFAVGRRSAAAARDFAEVHSADGDVHALARLIAHRHRGGPLLYLAGEYRAADLVGELARSGITAELRVVYRAVTVPLPPALIEALQAHSVDAVLHFSRRSAENFVSGARAANILPAALAVRHLCLSAQAAEPLAAAGASGIMVAPHPEEAALIALLEP